MAGCITVSNTVCRRNFSLVTVNLHRLPVLNGSASQSARSKLAASLADVLRAVAKQLAGQALALATAAVIHVGPAMTHFNGPVLLGNNAGFVHCIWK